MTHYYYEYNNFITNLLEDYVEDLQKDFPAIFKLGEYTVTLPVLYSIHLKAFFEEWSKIYEKWYKVKTIEEITAHFRMLLDIYYKTYLPIIEKVDRKAIKEYELYSELKSYRKQVMIYIYNTRQLEYIASFIKKLNCPVILMADFSITLDANEYNKVTCLNIANITETALFNSFIKTCFPLVLSLFNKFDLLIRLLQPSVIIVVDGSHLQEQILGMVGKQYAIPTVGIQQKWPLLLPYCFKNIPYDYFFTWGKHFITFWKSFNSHTQFLIGGYLKNVGLEKEKTKITFFFQSPAVVQGADYYNRFIRFIRKCAETFPNQQFWVREHPEYILPSEIHDQLTAYKNITFLVDYSLSEIFAETILLVASSSSCLMEGLAYNCIPFVLNFSSVSHYYPDMEKEGFGMVAENEDKGVEKMSRFIKDRVFRATFQQKYFREKSGFFQSFSDLTFNMERFIQKLIYR